MSDEYRYAIQDEGITNAGMKVLGFLFLFVWIVPIAFFVSLQSIEDTLPMMSSGGPIGTTIGTATTAGTPNINANAGYQYQQYQGGGGAQYQNYSYASNGSGASGGHGSIGGGGQKKKSGIFKGFVDSVLKKKEEMFPGVSKRQF